MTRNLAAHADSFNETQTAFDPDTEKEIIVLAADGKGVPMRRPLEQRLQEHRAVSAAKKSGEPPPADCEPTALPKAKRLKRGEKRTRKQMANVGAVYSIAPFKRTAEDIVNELRRKERQADRPRPQNKQVFAEMTRFGENEV